MGVYRHGPTKPERVGAPTRPDTASPSTAGPDTAPPPTARQDGGLPAASARTAASPVRTVPPSGTGTAAHARDDAPPTTATPATTATTAPVVVDDGGVPQCVRPPVVWGRSPGGGSRRVAPADVGLFLGYSYGVPVWVSVERPLYVLGPARSGKGVNFVINAILGAPGAVVTTSTRVDNMEATAICRAARGPVEVFNLDAVGGRPHTIRWSPLEGCADPDVAMRRAQTLVGAAGLGGENAAWAVTSADIVQALLHAAAISGKTISHVYEWSRSPSNTDIPMQILENESERPGGRRDHWHRIIDAVRKEDPRMQSNRWFGVQNAFAALAVARVRDLLDVPLAPDGKAAPGCFDTEAFLRSGGTCYMVARGVAAGATTGGVGGFYSLFLDHVTEKAHEIAQYTPGGRLDPPLALVLDELANIHPWPKAAVESAAGSGEGIWLTVVFQSREQADEAYGPKVAGTLWGNCANLILGGGKSEEYQRAVSALVGEWEQTRQRDSYTTRDPLERSTSTDAQLRPGISEAELRRLPFGVAVMLEGDMRTAVLDLVPYWQRAEHAGCIAASKKWHAAHPGLVLASAVVPLTNAHDDADGGGGGSQGWGRS